ncbi:hypothetical protein TrVE_jg11667 [Triparma verrucosa]|uniref:Pseudouridine synthase RsuA/RluA-like domain-containing protein n=1 Tax=Triparma verrucosa TaxID=1606542 RepID=A0A9W6ZBU1_9STRA|nr:hypothetical protein TrVE_jg11667 [Triparma verrucosa]
MYNSFLLLLIAFVKPQPASTFIPTLTSRRAPPFSYTNTRNLKASEGFDDIAFSGDQVLGGAASNDVLPTDVDFDSSIFYTSTPPHPPSTYISTLSSPSALNSAIQTLLSLHNITLPLSSINSLIIIGAVGVLKTNDKGDEKWYQQCLPIMCDTGEKIRVHYPVRRFPNFKDLKIVHSDNSFIVVDKPPMLPSQPFKGNRWESVVGYLECSGTVPTTFQEVTKILSTSQRPSLLNRLDLPVSGMIFLGTSIRSRSTFSKLSKEGKIKKQYQCVSYNKVKTGVKRLLLYTKDERGGGGMGCSKGQVLCSSDLRLLKQKDSGWTKCIMDVNSRTSFTRGERIVYEYTINLVTGRKHQIRSCMSYLGGSLVGDCLYEPMEGLGVRVGMEEEEVEGLERGLERGRTVRGRIGLRCVAVSVDGKVYRAKEPDLEKGEEPEKWWRHELA